MTTTKRSLFSKPSWASSNTAPIVATPDDDAIFGRHGGKIYADIIADEVKRKEKKAAKAKAKVEARQASEGRETKRRRISDDYEDGHHSDVASSKENESDDNKQEGLPSPGSVTRKKAAGKKSRLAAVLDSPVKPRLQKVHKDDTAPILLEDSDDLQIVATATVNTSGNKPSQQQPVVEPDIDPESDDDDEYIRDLKRRANAAALSSKQSVSPIKSPIDPSVSMAGSIELARESPAAPEVSSQKDEGPIVRIYITSLYPNTKSLIVNQPASRSLKKVKEVWCAKQGFDEAKTNEFFFAWNGARLFDSSNLMNTLEALKQQRPNEDDPSGGKIHLEAMNAAILEHRRQQKERKEAEAEAEESHTQFGEQAEPASEAPSPQLEKKIIISLQAKDIPPFKLSVRPSTQISKIMTAFHKQNGIEQGRVCWLIFDGDKLEPHSTVVDAGMEEDDVVEVHIR